MRYVLSMMLVVAMGVGAGCSSSSKATNFNGLADADGPKSTHINTTNWALNLFFVVKPIAGDASLQQTVADFTKEAKESGASKVRIVQSDEWLLWWIFPPFSFIVTPMRGNVAGDAIQ